MLSRRAAALLQPSVAVRRCSMCARPRGTSVSLTQAPTAAASSWTSPRLDSFVSIEPPAPMLVMALGAAAPSADSARLRPSAAAFTGSSHWRHAAARRSTQSSAPTGFSSAAHFIPATSTARLFSSSAAAASASVSAPAPSPPQPHQPPPQPPHLDTIHLHGLEFFSFHGVYPEETRAGQPFRLDLDLTTDLSRPGASDHLEHTVNYAAVFARVASIMQGSRLHKLLESLALRIIDELLESFPALQSVQVKLMKPKVAIPGMLEYAGVTIRRTREQRAMARQLQQQQQQSATGSSTPSST